MVGERSRSSSTGWCPVVLTVCQAAHWALSTCQPGDPHSSTLGAGLVTTPLCREPRHRTVRHPGRKWGARVLALLPSACSASQGERSFDELQGKVVEERRAAAVGTEWTAGVQRTPSLSQWLCAWSSLECHTKTGNMGNSWKTVCSVPLPVMEFISTW